MKSLEEKLSKIDTEINNGLKLKAADRLRNLINAYPNNLEIWERLAELYYEAGFKDAAGRYWILSEQNTERIIECVDLYRDSVNNSGTKILQDITFRGDKNELPEFSRNKLIELEEHSKKLSNYVPTYKPKSNKQIRNYENQIETFKEKLYTYCVFGVIILVVLSTLVGLITIARWLFT